MDAGRPDHAAEDGRVRAVAALADVSRAALYRVVIGRDAAVSRDEAAAAAGVTRSAAAFHLDRLVEEGLLDTEFRRLSGRRGPGAGRPSKLYRRAAAEISVSLPPRHYDLAADLLASAVTDAVATGTPVDAALVRRARERGAALATTLAPTTGIQDAADVLADHGYEPRVEDGEVTLANCPFHALAADHRQLVCGMNLALLEGFAGWLPELAMTARLQPHDRHCCVRLVPTAARAETTTRRRPA